MCSLPTQHSIPLDAYARKEKRKSFLIGGLVLKKLVPEDNDVSKLRLRDSPNHMKGISDIAW